MATSDSISSMHNNIIVYVGVGSLATLFGMSTYLMGYEYRDFDRLDIEDRTVMETRFQHRKKLSIAIFVLSAIFFFAGLVLITLGVSFHRDEREERAYDIPSLLDQVKENEAQPKVNEPAILSGISSGLIGIGGILAMREFHKTESYGWVGSSIFAAGWLAQAFAAATQNKSLSSLHSERLAWTLPGVAAIVAGSFMLPWQLQQTYISGPAWPLVAIGFAAFSIGTSYVLPARQV